MYGLVNKAVEQMARTQFGDAAWEAIRERAGLDIEVFLNMTQYDDAVTFRLVQAASEELGVPASDVLQAFGRYWILFTAQEGYGELLRVSGSTLAEFLLNLDAMHARVGLTYRNLQPPAFACTDVTPEGMLLHYRSSRVGLTHLVVGLLAGLAERFSTPTRVEVVASKEDGADHDIFRLRFLEPGAA